MNESDGSRELDKQLGIQIILNVMTDTQRRRYQLYLLGETLTKIASKEDVSVVAVWYSIKTGIKKAKKRTAHLKKT